MPAKDRHHDAVVRALRKAGWVILAEQVALSMPMRRVWVDIRASKEADNLAILIEVKGFERPASPVAYLAETIGQCLLYQTILDFAGVTDTLYLAVPSVAFTGILGEELGRQAIQRAQVRLILFDPVQEEITRWIP
ncbi:MAG TPA: element excision factor XisH family protein [Chloroflexota bacterium]|nr:element excision factor XisH family protein [Chloroflexota bacterium]